MTKDKITAADQAAGEPADRPAPPARPVEPARAAAAPAPGGMVRLVNHLTGASVEVDPYQYDLNRAMWNAQGFEPA